MCSKCDDIRREIALNRGLSMGPLDPASLIRNNAELRALEAKLDVTVGGHFEAARASSQVAYEKERLAR